MAAVIIATTPVRAVRAREAPHAPKRTAPRYEGLWRGREESPGAPVPAFRLDVPPPTPTPSDGDDCLHCGKSLALHAWTLPLCRKKDCEIDDCWCHIKHHELVILTNPVYVHYQKPTYGNPADEYLDTVLTNMCAHESWIPAEDTEDLDLDWAHADPSWSHETVAEATPLEVPHATPLATLYGCEQCISPREGTSPRHPHASRPRFSCEIVAPAAPAAPVAATVVPEKPAKTYTLPCRDCGAIWAEMCFCAKSDALWKAHVEHNKKKSVASKP